MSEQEASDKVTFKAYAQLPYKPFKFTEPTEQLNLRLVANIDPDQLYYRGDLDQASAVLKNFVNSHIPEEMDYEMFNKLFRLSQLAIEYYSQEQANRQQVIDDQYLKYKQLQEQEKNLADLKTKHNEKKEIYKEQIKQLSNKIKEMKKEAERIGSYKCVYCSKAYRDKEGLDSHVKRRHLDMLNEIQETKDMIKERQDPIYQLKKKQQDEIREQNKIQLERLQQLQKQLEQAKINESKLVEQITSKLKQDINLKISEAITLKNEEKQKELEKSTKILQQKEQIQQKNQIKEQEINQYLEKMNQNLENFQKNFSKIQEQQEKMAKQQEEYTKQLEKISENQEDLKKSSLQQSALIKEQQQSMYIGNIVSNKTAPLPINTKQNSKQELFPVQTHPTADFKNTGKQSKSFFNQEEEDSFLNNSSSVIEDQQIRDFKGLNAKSGFLQAKVLHIGDLEDDIDSEDENRKSYLKQKQEDEIRSQIKQEFKSDNENKVNLKSQTYIYQDPQSMSSENNNKNQNGVKSLSAIQDQELLGQQRMSQTLIEDDKSKLKNVNSTKKTSKKLIEEQNKIDESEKKQFFQSDSNTNTQETPRQPNVLSNQMSFGVKGLEVGSEQNLGRKSMFSSQKGKKIDDLHISEQPSKEQQRSLVSSDVEQNDKKDQKKHKNKGDKKKSQSNSDKESNSSSSSLSDISARMKDNYKKKNKNKNSNHSSKKSIGNVKDIPSPHPKDEKDTKLFQEQKKSINQLEEDSKTMSKKQIVDDKRKQSQEANPSSQNNSFEMSKKDLNQPKSQPIPSDNQKLKENNSTKEELNSKSKEEYNKAKESEESSFMRRGSKDSFTNNQLSPRESKNQISQKDVSTDQQQSLSLRLMQPPPALSSSQQDSLFDKIQKTDSIPTTLSKKQQSQQEIKEQKLSKFGQKSLDTEQQNKPQASLNKIDTNRSEKNQDQSGLQQKNELNKSEDTNKQTPLKVDSKQTEGKQDKQASLSQNQIKSQPSQNDLLKNQNEQKQTPQMKLQSQKSIKNEEENKQNQIDRNKNESDKNLKSEADTKSKTTEVNKNIQNEANQNTKSPLLVKKIRDEEKNLEQLKAQEQNKLQILSLKKADDSGFDFYKSSPRQEQQLTATEQNYQVEHQLLSINHNSDEDKKKKQHVYTIGRHQIKHEEKKEEAPGFKPFVNSEIDKIRKELSSKQKNKIDKLEKKYGDFSDDDDEIDRELEDSKEKQKNKNKLAGAFEEIDDDDF
ncbi:hypothetical protein ABPG72_018745 [Tetrahymena utriculariae]